MTDIDFITLMQTWGYYLEPKVHAFSPGYAGISVAIRAKPTHQHYDPEWIDLCLLMQGSVEHVRLGQQTRRIGRLRVCPGWVTLHDRLQRRADFYTYGAELSSVYGKDETFYRFESSAPILWMGEDDNSFPEQLGAETEAILARIHAQWRRQDSLFARRLADIEPIDLYFATLRSIGERYSDSPALKDHFQSFYASLQREILWQRATGHFQAEGPRLETLLPAPNMIA